MKRNKFFILLSTLSLLLNSCDNPFAKYAKNYVNVIWSSTSASSLNIKLYALEENVKNVTDSLCIININEKNYYCCSCFHRNFNIGIVDEYGIVQDGYVASKNQLEKDLIYCSTISSVPSIDSKTGNILNIEVGDYIELEMKDFNPKEEATPLMFSNVKYISLYNNFTTYSKERGYSGNLTSAENNTFFVSYGTMNINNTYVDVALKFLPDNKFFIFRNDDIKDIIYSGTYTNSWTDITLYFETNEIDDTKSIDIKAEFFS